jgi:galactose oxidase-like protein
VTGNTEYVFLNQTAALLGNGQVLVAGGQSSYCTAVSPNGPCVTDLTTSIAELYDASSGAFSPAGSMVSRRDGHQAAPLPNGDAIEIGASPDPPDFTQSAEVYDLASGTFSLTPGELIVGRVGSFTATALQNGQILVAGGEGSAAGSGILSEAEIYDPTTERFTPTGSMTISRSGHTATLLNDGRVLITGGAADGPITGNPSGIQQSAELYDPARRVFAATGNMNVARSLHTATLLSDGRVLIAGGLAPLKPLPTPVCPPPPSLAPCFEQISAATASAEIYDPSTGVFTLTGDMTVARASHSATLLK